MTGEGPRRDADKSRQELLDELYYLRDVAGEREQRARQQEKSAHELEQRTRELEQHTRELEQHTHELEQHTHELEQHTRELEQHTRELEHRGAALKEALQAVLDSRSWRWTRPLRRVLRRQRQATLDDELVALAHIENIPRNTERSVVPSTAAVVAQAVVPAELPLGSPDALRGSKPRLYVDVTELALREGQTGIQRAVREIARALLVAPPEGYSIELVCAEPGQPYRSARAFAARLMKREGPVDPEVQMELQAGDVFLGLDHAMDTVIGHADELAAMKAGGVKLWFMLNDTLPLIRPDWFPPEVPIKFRKWFETIVRSGDGIACISQTTANGALDCMDRLQLKQGQTPVLDWFHLGADAVAQTPSGAGITPDQTIMLERLPGATSFLMVGTLEPRKGHAQALEAFNRLWADGEDALLVIVGKPGWMTEVTQRRIRHHDEFGRRLFWLMDADDDLLDRLYNSCTVLLAPSEGEGFGLPLVEAARHGLPVLCRDLPVFREVAGSHATYFSGLDAESLAQAIRDWQVAYGQGTIPTTTDMPYSSWSDSAARLVGMIATRGPGNLPASRSKGAQQA